MLCKEEEIRKLIAYEMQLNPETNPEGLPIEVFIDRLKKEPLTPELINQYLKDKVELPKYGTKNHYQSKAYDTLDARM